jgi:hypothetical protein
MFSQLMVGEQYQRTADGLKVAAAPDVGVRFVSGF